MMIKPFLDHFVSNLRQLGESSWCVEFKTGLTSENQARQMENRQMTRMEFGLVKFCY